MIALEILGFSESETRRFNGSSLKEAKISAFEICFTSSRIFGYPLSHVSSPNEDLFWFSEPRKPPSVWKLGLSLCSLI
jgi:hypothetical protein